MTRCSHLGPAPWQQTCRTEVRVIDEISSGPIDSSIAWRLRAVAVNDAVSRVAIQFAIPEDQKFEIAGHLRGPLCEYATTLAAKYPLNRTSSPNPQVTTYLADIPESCLWEPAHPFRYAVSFSDGSQSTEALIGLRSLSLQRSSLTLNGNPFRFRGIATKSVSPEQMKHLHAIDCNLLFTDDEDIAADADQWGPMIVGNLFSNPQELSQQMAAAGPLHPSIGIWRIGDAVSEQDLIKCRGIDMRTLIARHGSLEKETDLRGADLLLVDVEEKELASLPGINVPWLPLIHPSGPVSLDVQLWKTRVHTLDQLTKRLPGCLGWVLMES